MESLSRDNNLGGSSGSPSNSSREGANKGKENLKSLGQRISDLFQNDKELFPIEEGSLSESERAKRRDAFVVAILRKIRIKAQEKLVDADDRELRKAVAHALPSVSGISDSVREGLLERMEKANRSRGNKGKTPNKDGVVAQDQKSDVVADLGDATVTQDQPNQDSGANIAADAVDAPSDGKETSLDNQGTAIDIGMESQATQKAPTGEILSLEDAFPQGGNATNSVNEGKLGDTSRMRIEEHNRELDTALQNAFGRADADPGSSIRLDKNDSESPNESNAIHWDDVQKDFNKKTVEIQSERDQQAEKNSQKEKRDGENEKRRRHRLWSKAQKDFDAETNVIQEERDRKVEEASQEEEVINGIGLVEEPKPEIVFTETGPEVVGEKGNHEESIDAQTIEAARQRMEELGERYARICGRTDKMRNQLERFFHFPVKQGFDIEELEKKWKDSVLYYKQLRLAQMKQESSKGKLSIDELKRRMAEFVREVDLKGNLAAINQYDDAKWGESGDTWKSRLLGRSKKFAEEYRKFCKEHPAQAFLLRGAILGGAMLSGGATLALPVGFLGRMLGSYTAGRGLKEFLDRRANEKLVEAFEQSEAMRSTGELSEAEGVDAYFEKMAKQLGKLDTVGRFESFRKGAKLRASAALFVGGGLFLGGTALSHFSHAAQGAIEAKGAVGVGNVVDAAEDTGKGIVADTVQQRPNMQDVLSAVKQYTGETQVVGGAIPALEMTQVAEHVPIPLSIPQGGSIEGTIIQQLTGQGISKEEAGKIAHRMALVYAREHGISVKDLNVIQPDTHFNIAPDLSDTKTPFKIDGNIGFGPKVQDVAMSNAVHPEASHTVPMAAHEPTASAVKVPSIGNPVLEQTPSMESSPLSLHQISPDFRSQLNMLALPNVENAARVQLSELFSTVQDEQHISGEVFRLLFPGQRMIPTETTMSFLRRSTFEENSMARVAQLTSVLRQLSGYSGTVSEWSFRQQETIGSWLGRMAKAIVASPEYQRHIASAASKTV